MAVANPAFDVAGAKPGEADSWTLASNALLQRVAGFGEPALGYEEFEWYAYPVTLDGAVRGFFNATDGVEDFSVGWGVVILLSSMSDAQIVSYGAESFEQGWANAVYASSLADVTTVASTFGGPGSERFDSGWQGNQAFLFDWSMVVAVASTFDAGAQAVEDFENGWS